MKFLDLLKTKDVRLFSFIMGNSANRPLLQGMSRVSNGFSMSVSNGDDIVGRIIQAASKLTHMAYRDLSVNVSGVKVADITSSHLSTLYRGQQMVVLGYYWGEGEAKVEINGRVGSELKRYEAELSFPEKDLMHPELERLWAFASIDALQERIDYLGEDTDTRQAIVDIAVEYGLVTDYTSMIVMAEEQFAKYGIERNNAKRVEIEQSARAARAQAAPSAGASPQRGANNFSQPRAGASGGGAIHPMLLLVGLILLGLHKKAQRSRRR
ncbi:hypothetical protein GYB62_03055 [bacterium]|nr:hypothetical protein [bacterium]